MKITNLLKVTAVAVFTTGFVAGCASDSSDSTTLTQTQAPAVAEACEATPEARNAIYAAKLKNARARNLGQEWRDTADIIDEAEQATADCENVRAKILADKAEEQASDAIAQYHRERGTAVPEEDTSSITIVEPTEAQKDTSSSNSAGTSESGTSSDGTQSASGSSQSASGSTQSASAASTPSKYIGGYLVVRGDNLWSIAGQDSVYGDPYQWPLIYKANAGQIKDADLIFPGQYFNIPRAIATERAAAIEHAKSRGAWTLGQSEATDIRYLNQ